MIPRRIQLLKAESVSQPASEIVLFEKLERYMTASFRRLISSASSETRHPQAVRASARTSIAATGICHDRDHRRALQLVFSGKLPRGATGNLGADPVKTFEGARLTDRRRLTRLRKRPPAQACPVITRANNSKLPTTTTALDS
jgi:hypothetical protein